MKPVAKLTARSNIGVGGATTVVFVYVRGMLLSLLESLGLCCVVVCVLLLLCVCVCVGGWLAVGVHTQQVMCDSMT